MARKAGRCHRQGQWVGGQAAVCHQRVAAIKRGDPAPRHVGGKQQRLTMEHLDEIREFIEEEHGRISVRTVALRFTLSRSSSRRAISMLRLCPLVAYRAPSGGPSHP